MTLEALVREIVREEVARALGELRALDELVRLPGPLERAAAKKLVRSGKLKVVRVGRSWYAKNSDLLALVDQAPPAPVVIDFDARAQLRAAAERRPPRRKAS